MELTPEQHYLFATVLKNYFEFTDYVGLTRKEAQSPGAGAWLVDFLKQHQTSIGIIKTMQMNKSILQSETSDLPPLPPTVNPNLPTK